MRVIKPPALFELHARKMAECRGLAPLARRHALVSTEARLARPVDIPKWSAWGDLHSQGYSILSRIGLLFPVNHTPVGDPGLAPGRLGDFKSPGSAVPAEASRREMVGMKGIAPPRLPDSESEPSAIRVEPHAHENWHSRQDSHLQPRRSKRRALVNELRERNGADGESVCTRPPALSRGKRPAVYKTAAVAAEPRRQNGESPR